MSLNKPNSTHIFDKFKCWSVADGACEFCIHYPGKNKPCPHEICYCAEEKSEALRREAADENRLAVAFVGM